MKHTLKLVAFLLLMPLFMCISEANANGYVVQDMYNQGGAYGYSSSSYSSSYSPFSSSGASTQRNLQKSYQSNSSLTRSTTSQGSIFVPFSGSTSPFSAAAAASDDDDDDWGTGTPGGFDNVDQPGDKFKQPLDAPLVLLLFAAAYAFAKFFFRLKTEKHRKS